MATFKAQVVTREVMIEKFLNKWVPGWATECIQELHAITNISEEIGKAIQDPSISLDD